MLGIVKRATFFIVVGTLASSAVLRAQQANDPHAAPVPSQIVNAKKVFISNASGLTAGAAAAPDLAYNEFYGAMKSWGRYELVGAPADADVVFEIRYVIALGTINVSDGRGYTAEDPEFTLVLLDPKTRTVLWAFTESLHRIKKQTGREAFDQTLARIVDDLKKLASPAASAAK